MKTTYSREEMHATLDSLFDAAELRDAHPLKAAKRGSQAIGAMLTTVREMLPLFRISATPGLDLDEPRVRARILVAVDDERNWIAHGRSDASDATLRDEIFVDELAVMMRYSFVEADLPIPPPAETLKGVVTDE